MHRNILSENQEKLLPLIAVFTPQFGLVSGTAIALYLGHRRSIDFDLFTLRTFDIERVKSQIHKTAKIEHTYIQGENELTVLVNQVKLTFYSFPYSIKFEKDFDNVITLPSLLTLGAMKAFALGKRAKWKDYVDLFFLLKQFSLRELATQADVLFGAEFNEKFFRVQLAYFEDIDYSEDVLYMPGHKTNQKEIKQYLEEASLQ